MDVGLYFSMGLRYVVVILAHEKLKGFHTPRHIVELRERLAAARERLHEKVYVEEKPKPVEQPVEEKFVDEVVNEVVNEVVVEEEKPTEQG